MQLILSEFVDSNLNFDLSKHFKDDEKKNNGRDIETERASGFSIMLGFCDNILMNSRENR